MSFVGRRDNAERNKHFSTFVRATMLFLLRSADGASSLPKEISPFAVPRDVIITGAIRIQLTPPDSTIRLAKNQHDDVLGRP